MCDTALLFGAMATQYLAVVKETEDKSFSMTKVVEEGTSLDELKVKRQAQKMQLSQTNEAYKSAKETAKTEAEKDEKPRAFKRPALADANQMIAFLGEKQKHLDVMLEDSWKDVKNMACEAFGVGPPENYRMQIIQEMPEDKMVKKKARPAKVGELCVWDCTIRLSNIGGIAPSAESSSSSASVAS